MCSSIHENCAATDFQSSMTSGSAIDSLRSASRHSAAAHHSFSTARYFHSHRHCLKIPAKPAYSASAIPSLVCAKLVSRHFATGMQSSPRAFAVAVTSFPDVSPQLS